MKKAWLICSKCERQEEMTIDDETPTFYVQGWTKEIIQGVYLCPDCVKKGNK